MGGESNRFAPAVAHYLLDAAAWLDAQSAAAGVRMAPPARDGLLGALSKRLAACAHTALDESRRLLAPLPPPEEFAASVDWGAFLADYPVVARLVDGSIATWRRSTADLMAHIARDRRELGAGAALEAVRDHGEMLQARRAMFTVELGGGARWVYRTKNLRMAAWFMELCAGLNAGLSRDLHVRRILVRDGCSWDELVVARPCHDADEIAGYFHRAGLLLCLLERLDATDFHAENVMAVGPHPVLVDIETLFHPTPMRATPATRAYWGSPLRTGMLDAWFYGEPGRRAAYAGGLHPGGRIEMPFRARRLRQLDGAVGGEEEFYETADVAATVPEPFGDHIDELLAGYREMDGATLRLAGGRALPGRRVQTGGEAYERLLIKSLRPELLRSAGARDAWLATTRLGPEEVTAIRDLVFPLPAITTAAWQPIRRAERELRLQLLETCVALLDDREAPRHPAPSPPPSPTAAAIAIGDTILDAGFPGPEWLGVVARPWAGLRAINVLPPDLLSGTAGIALVLAQLYAVSRCDRFRDCALTILTTLPAQPSPPGFVGAHIGYGGAIYALARAAPLVDAPALATRAALLVERLPRGWLESGPWDVVSGVAGLVLGSLATGAPPRQAVMALRAAWEGDLGEPPLVAGTLPAWLPPVDTGVAHVLGRAAAALGEPEFSVPMPAGGPVLWRLGLEAEALPEAARAVADPATDALDALDLALTAHDLTGSAVFADAARARVEDLIARRQKTGRWFPDTRVAERLHLSALTGLAAVAHGLLRFEAPGLLGSIRRLD